VRAGALHGPAADPDAFDLPPLDRNDRGKDVPVKGEPTPDALQVKRDGMWLGGITHMQGVLDLVGVQVGEHLS